MLQKPPTALWDFFSCFMSISQSLACFSLLHLQTERQHSLQRANQGKGRPSVLPSTPLVLQAKARAPARCCRYQLSDLHLGSSSFTKCFQNTSKANLWTPSGLIRRMSISLTSGCCDFVQGDLVTVQGVHFFLYPRSL